MRGIALILGALAATPLPASEAPPPSAADELLVVNCLLPGQIRQLGQRTTYVSARRPVRTTALECRVRGGEYVLHDRANLKTALRVWLQAAQEGDADAQTTLGEIFEQGLGVPPDYDAARTWYEKGAQQGLPRALTNLGNLYERGLGVPTDRARALELYRQAAGLPPRAALQLQIENAPDVAPVASVLNQDVQNLQQALEALRNETAALKADLAASENALRTAVADTQNAVDAARAEGAAAAQQEAERRMRDALADRAQLIAEYQQRIGERDDRIAELAAVAERMPAEQGNTAALAEEVGRLNQVIDGQRAELDASEADLRASHSEQSELRVQLENQQAELSRRERQARAHADRVKQLLAEIHDLQAQAAPVASPVSQQALLAGPTVTMVEPLLPSTRGLVKVRVPARAQRTSARIIGRVSAPAGLLSLTINDEPEQANATGVFVHEVKLGEGHNEVLVTAIDQQGKRADLRFEMVSHSTPANPSQPEVNLGDFHALLIGNSNYRNLPRLVTPQHDVASLESVLRSRYGFSVQTLHDATRYEILSALNDVRGRLTSNDNLLIYYAGHGELDRANMRGHWLPVDAEPNSTANWISNVAITDILNVIRARHILLVVDSCYSGTLTRSSLTQIDAAMTDEERDTWLKLLATKKARVVLTSGGLAPVLDVGGGGHSVFAKAFLAVLENNADLLTGRSLYQAVAARVAHAASEYEFEQIPAYAPIARSGHEAGDFMMVPTRL